MADEIKNCESCYWRDDDGWCDLYEMYAPGDYCCPKWKSREDQDE